MEARTSGNRRKKVGLVVGILVLAAVALIFAVLGWEAYMRRSDYDLTYSENTFSTYNRHGSSDYWYYPLIGAEQGYRLIEKEDPTRWLPFADHKVLENKCTYEVTDPAAFGDPIIYFAKCSTGSYLEPDEVFAYQLEVDDNGEIRAAKPYKADNLADEYIALANELAPLTE